MPTEEVTILATNSSGVIVGAFDSGQHTGPAGLTPPFSADSTQIQTGFSNLGGVSMTSGQHTADNNYPAATVGTLGLGQYLESIVNDLTNSNSTATTLTLVVSAKNYSPGVGSVDGLDNIDLSGSITNGLGSSVTAKWYEDNGNGISTITGIVGSSAPVLTLAGSQVGSTFNYTAPDSFVDSFSTSQNNLPVNFTNPFSMTLVTTLNLSAGAIESNRTQAQLAEAAVPEPATTGLAAVLSACALLGFGRRRMTPGQSNAR
jgi:hypothetical protein